ncbi:fibronectin type III domain-containing protein [Candidatus Giovannonibacteria bacterium]|nr:fibronectin type III domain-containing protein [Candidatus Giovannonibacteria bacterium]
MIQNFQNPEQAKIETGILKKDLFSIGTKRVHPHRAWSFIAVAVMIFSVAITAAGIPTIDEITYADGIIPEGSGLKVHWKFDEGTGTTAADSSGNNVNASLLNGATFSASGKVGGALSLDGVDDYALGDSGQWSGAFTISLWVKPSSASNEGGGVFASSNNWVQANTFEISTGGNGCYGAYRFEAYGNGGGGIRGCMGVYGANTWTMLTATFDGNRNAIQSGSTASIKLYRNGQFIGFADGYQQFSGLFTTYKLGRDRGGEVNKSNYFFKGDLDEVRIYNRALSTQEVLDIYNSDSGTPSPPPAPDTTAPTVPSGLSASTISSSQINLSWSASTDAVGVTGYKIYRGGVQIATSNTISYSDTGLTASTLYSYTVAAYDAAGNTSAQSSSASATTQASSPTPTPDTTAPSVPTGLSATAVSSSQINLSWTASTDAVGVTGYKIYRSGTQIATSNTTTYSNIELSASTLYSYTVAAYDAAGNTSAQSGSASATTQAFVPSTYSVCVPRGTVDPTYRWDKLNIYKDANGLEHPTASSYTFLKTDQTSQIAIDTARNVQVAFISGVTMEAPVGTENWTVVQTQTCPSARWAGAMAYDSLNKEMVLFGGTLSIAGPTNDTWIYNTVSRDWTKLDPGSASLRDLRAKVALIGENLETLRWNLWKTLEWKTTGKTGAMSESALNSDLSQIKINVSIASDLASIQSTTITDTYEKSQVTGVSTWLISAETKLASIGSGISGGTLAGLETDYRSIISLQNDIASAKYAVNAGPTSRYFISLNYDASQNGFTIASTVGASYSENWLYSLARKRWERSNPIIGSATTLSQPTGEFVLRDNATVSNLQSWKTSTDNWKNSIQPNTWMIAPTNGTGRPNWGRTWSSIVYDPDRQQIYYRDGGHGSYHGSVTDHYDILTGRWFRSDWASAPDSRIIGSYFGWGRDYNYAPWAIHNYKRSLFYNPFTESLNRYVIFGPDAAGGMNDYNPDQGKWSKDILTSVPSNVPAVPDGFIFVDGWERYSSRPTTKVYYTTSTGMKIWDDTGRLPYPVDFDVVLSLFFNPTTKKLYYYGGSDAELGVYSLDLSLANPRWAKLSATVRGGGSLPFPSREVTYIPKYNVFLMLEGWSDYNDTRPPQVWVFDPNINEWSKMNMSYGSGVIVGQYPGNLNPMGISSGLAYDNINDLAFYITGTGQGGTPSLFTFRYAPSDLTAPSAPTNLSATPASDTQINLAWSASSDSESGILKYNVFRNGTLVASPNTNSYSDTGLIGGTSYTYQVSAVNGVLLESAKSASVSQSTFTDISPPTIVSAAASDSSSVSVIFSEPVEQISATQISNYGISNGITISSASLGADLKTVTLSVSSLTAGTSYVLTVSNVKDRASLPNTILANSQTSFTFTSGLVAHWKFDEGAGFVASDSSGSNNTGNISAATWTSGKIGQALSFDGSSSYVDFGNPSSLKITGSQTISIWLYPTDFSQRRNPISKAYGGEGTITVETDGTVNYFYGTCGGDCTPYQGFTMTSALTANSWTNLVLVRDLSAMKLRWYKNSVLINESTANYSSAVASASSLLVGKGYVYNFAGNIDDIRIYNRALSIAEVQSIYTSVPAPVPDTIAPSVPAGLTATAISSSQINLSWAASTDNVAVTGYKIYRGGVQIATSNTTSYSNIGLTASTLYSYTVAAYDAAGNTSGQSGSASATTLAVGQVDITSGLVGHWKLDETSGISAADSSGNSNNGTISNGPLWASGKINGALKMDGVDDYVTVSNSANLNPAVITLSAWINPATIAQEQKPIILKSYTSHVSPYYQYYLFWYNTATYPNTIAFGINVNGSLAGAAKSNAFTPPGWHLVTGTFDGSASKLYVDGVEASSANVSGSLTSYPTELHFGRYRNIATDSIHNFAGSIDDIRIYNRALTAADVQALYATAPPPAYTFSLSNGGTKSIVQGSFISNSITATLSSGIGQPITFSASGLPQGASHSFSSTSCTPTCATNLTISTTATTPPGTYNIVVSGTGLEGTKSTSFSLNVSTAPTDPSTAPPLPAGSIQVPLTVKEALPAGISGMSRTSELVSVGIPLPENSGAISTSQLGLSGTTAGQFRTLAKWPNGNIKWVLADFLASVSAGGTTNVSLTTGAGNFGGTNLAADNGNTININTGPAQFVIKKSNFNVFDSVIINGQTLVNTGNNGKLVMRDSSDNEYNSSNDPFSAAVIEENGPVKTVIKAAGSFKDLNGTRLAGYTLRMTFYKGDASVKTLFAITNSDVASRAHTNFNSVEAVVPINIGVTKIAEYATKVGSTSGNISSGETSYLFQGYSLDKLDASGRDCFNWKPPVPGTCDSNFTYQYDQSKAGLEIKIGQNTANVLGNQSDWTGGWGELRDSSGKGVSMAYRWMSSYWPSGFEMKGDGSTSIEIFSKRNTKKGLTLVFGKHEAREIIWDFHSAAGNNQKTLYKLQYPLIAQAPFSHYQNTKAIFGQDEFVTPAEQTKFFTDMGKSTWAPNLGNLSMYRIYRSIGWGTGGGGNQTDFPLNDLQDFLRTGNPGFYLLGEQRTLFNNTAFVRTDNGGVPSGFDPEPSWSSSINGSFIDMEHAHVLSTPFYYLLTGNEWIKEGFLDYGDYLEYTETGWKYYAMPTNPWNRSWDRKLRNMALLYEFSCQTGNCNTKYRDYLTNWMDYYLSSRDNPSNKYVHGRNIERGYRYWAYPWAEDIGLRPVQALTDVQIHFEAMYQALRVMEDTAVTYLRQEELEDYLTGLSQFIFNEYYDEINGGDALEEFGFMYGYPLDSASTINGGNYWLTLAPYDASRPAFWGYQKTGDASMLTKANKLIWAITEYATGRSPSELQDQALMYTHFNPPATWKPLSVSAANNGGGSYTLSWNVPAGTTKYQIKYSPKPIVEWLGFNKVTRTYQYDPAQYTAFFAATNISNEPAPLSSGTQTFTLSGLSCGSNCYFAAKYYDGEVGSVTPPPSDTQAPTIPTNLSATAISSSQINLSWTASTDAVGVTGYKIYRSGVQIATSNTTSYSDTGLAPSTAYSYTVSAFDAAGNNSSQSTSASATTQPASVPVDTTAPVISGISSSGITSSSANILWNTNEMSTHQVEYGPTASYGQLTTENTAMMTSHSETISNLQSGSTYNFRVKSKDAAGNLAISLNSSFKTLNAPDNIPPNAISNLSSSEIQTNSLKLSWTSPADPPSNSAADKYDIRYSMSLLGESNWQQATRVTGEPAPASPGANQSYILAGLAPQTTYYIAIKSSDAKNNDSALSNVLQITTLASEPPPAILSVSPITANIQDVNSTLPGVQFYEGMTVRYSSSASGHASWEWLYSVNNGTPISYLKGTGNVEDAMFKYPSGSAGTSYKWIFRASSGTQIKEEALDVSIISRQTGTNPAVISNIAFDIGQTSATVTWETDIPASTQLEFGAHNLLGSLSPELNSTSLVTAHSVTSSNLIPCARYYFRVRSRDSSNNISAGAPYSYSTKGCLGGADVASSTEKLIRRAEGGTIKQKDKGSGLTITAPINFASDDAVFQIQKLSNKVFSTAQLPQNKKLIGDHIYELKALSDSSVAISAFADSLTLTVKYNSADLGNINPSTLRLYRWVSSSNSWQVLSCTESTADAQVICLTNSFSSYALLGDETQTTGGGGSSGGGTSSGGGGIIMQSVSAPASFKAIGAPNQIILSWSNPKDANFVRARIIKNQNRVPLSANDGEIIYEGAKEEFIDTNVTLNAVYNYGVYALDRNLNASALSTLIVKAGEKSEADALKALSQIVSASKVTAPVTSPGALLTGPFAFGIRSEQVKILQEWLARDKLIYPEAKITGYYGPATFAAVKRFQKKYGIAQIGIAGPKTRMKLNALYNSSVVSTPEAPSSSETIILLRGPFYLGARGNEVKVLQQLLAKDNAIYPEGRVTGYYGALTFQAVKRFQAKYGILQTGIAGPKTRAKLNEIY